VRVRRQILLPLAISFRFVQARCVTIHCMEMRLTRSDKTNAIVVVAIAVGACLVWWFLMR
jgi:hypothetical protein